MTKNELKLKIREAYWASTCTDLDEDRAEEILGELRWLRWQLRRCEAWHGSQGLALSRELLSRARKNCSVALW